LAVGAVGGGVAGAGTGAIIGSVISNGAIGASAVAGGAIGIPVGLAVGMIYDYNSEASVRERKLNQIEANHRELFNREREIEAMREQILNDGPSGSNPSEELRDYQYDGNTLGNYYR